MSYKDLKQKIITKRARIAIIGIGYVGLPLAISFSKKKYKGIIGIEKNKFIIKLLKSNKSHLSHISDNEVSKLKANFEITNKMKELTNL